MARLLVLSCLGVLAATDAAAKDDAGAPTAQAARPGAAAGAPRSAAVTVHTADGDRLALADLESGSYQPIGGAGASEPVWSPDGEWLAFRSGAAIYAVKPSGGSPVRVASAIYPWGARAYAFSPDSKMLAVAAKRAGVELWRVDGAAPSKVATVPTKLTVMDLTWADDAQHVGACTWNGRDGAEARELFVVVAVTGAPAGGPAGAARPLERKLRSCALYGRRQAKWLLKSVRGDGGDQVLAIADDGTTERLFRAPAYQRGVAYVASLDAVLLAHEGEDTGDPTQIDLAPLASPGARARPWLRRYKRLAELAISTDGRFVLFTHLSASGELEGGEIFLATIDGQDVRRVLPGRASRKATFSHAVPRPGPTP